MEARGTKSGTLYTTAVPEVFQIEVYGTIDLDIARMSFWKV